MKAFVVGFPKAGTTTINDSLASSGFNTVHWTYGRDYIGEMIYRNYYQGLDPLAGFQEIDAITQADVCMPALELNYWPNLDFTILDSIRRNHSECLFILNWRDPSLTASSIRRWSDLQDRIIMSDIPGLPRGYGKTQDELVRWIEGHHKAVRRFFRGSNFLEVDISSADAPRKLGDALNLEIMWWGQANINCDGDGGPLPPDAVHPPNTATRVEDARPGHSKSPFWAAFPWVW